MAKRNAEQAEQMAKTLRKQADDAQVQADKYEEKAQSLDSQANNAQVNSDEARLRLNLSNAFDQAGSQLAKNINHAVVKKDTYQPQDTGIVTTTITDQPTIGSQLDILA